MLAELTTLKRAASPEAAGVKSEVILDFLKDLDKHSMNMHSLMIIRNGEVASECYYHPYKAEFPMSMFSFSKGVTATAIGFAVDEGKLSLDDKVEKFFPFTCKNDKNQLRHDEATVYDLLTQRSGKKIPTIYDSEINKWDEFWLNAPFKDKPGEKFNYLSENTYMLSRIVTAATGEKVVDYLTPRLFEPLGIEKPFWETDHDGNTAGGWGAFLKLEDIGKFGMFYLNKGKYNGKQLLSEKWFDEAVMPHVKKVPSIFQKNTGYGYQIFVQPDRHTYSFNGLYGQFVVVYPEYNAVFACTSGECDEYTFIHTLNKYLPSAFADEPLATPVNNDLKSYVYLKSHPVIATAMRNTKAEEMLRYKSLSIKNLNAYASIMGPSTSFMLSQKAGNIDNIRMDFQKDRIILKFCESNSDEQSFEIGLDGEYLYSEVMLTGIKLHLASYATWTHDGKLEITVIPLEMAQKRIMTFTFHNDSVRVHAEAKPGFYELLNFYLMFNGFKPILPIRGIVKVVSAFATHTYDPNYHGKLTDI